MFSLVIATALLAVLVLALIGWRQLRSDPLAEISESDRALIRRPEQVRKEPTGPISKLATSLGREFSSLLGNGYRNWVMARNAEAGTVYSRFENFMAMKAKLFLYGLAPALLILVVVKQPLLAALMVTAMFFVPDISLWSKASERQSEIDDALPDFLDILAVTVSAGLSFRGALQRVIERTEGPLSDELLITMRQLDVGESVSSAFLALKNRTKSDSVNSFVTALLQSQELGSPLSEALDQIAESMRQETAQKARQRASKASPKISAVVSFIMVPATMLLLGVTMFYASGINLKELIDLG